jgi:predicted peptidase
MKQYPARFRACGSALLALGLGAFLIPWPAPAEEAMQTSQQFKQKISRTLSAQYLLFLPKGYNARGPQRWPLLLFLHGAGERGADLQRVKVHGPPKILKKQPDFPFILVSPQCPDGEVWSDEVVLGLLDQVQKKYKVDPTRVYLTGLSMGGFGTWSLGTKYPERFAAIAPICGGGEPLGVLLASRTKVAALKSLGVWAFHGAKDPVVDVTESERMVNALKKAGVTDVTFTIYPEAQHDSWTETYENPKLYSWLLEHQRREAGSKKSK